MAGHVPIALRSRMTQWMSRKIHTVFKDNAAGSVYEQAERLPGNPPEANYDIERSKKYRTHTTITRTTTTSSEASIHPEYVPRVSAPIQLDTAAIEAAKQARTRLSHPQRMDLDHDLWISVMQSSRIQHIRKLVQCGADVNSNFISPGKRSNSTSVLAYEIMFSRRPDVLRLFFEVGADPNSTMDRFGPVLVYAAYSGYESIVEMLLAQGADPNAGGEEYSSPLEAAQASWNEESKAAIIATLIRYGAKAI